MTNNPNLTAAEKLAALTGVSIKDVARTLDFYGRPYRVYTALLSQDGTVTPPTVTVLENTFQVTPIFSYVSIGQYFINFPENFLANKTWYIMNTSGVDGLITNSDGIGIMYTGNGSFLIETGNISSAGFADGLLNNTPLEIRVYN